jgi:phage FluMu protein Com
MACYATRLMNLLHATLEEFAGNGYMHIECFCPRCRVIRLRPISQLPRISLGLTIAQLSARLRCAECGG